MTEHFRTSNIVRFGGAMSGQSVNCVRHEDEFEHKGLPYEFGTVGL